MNISKLVNSYTFKDSTDSLFKVQSQDCGLPSKISSLLKFDEDNFSARFCKENILCVGHGSLITWKYNLTQKNSIGSFIEYSLPSCASGHNCKQTLKTSESDCVIVTNDGFLRYWPKSNSPSEFIDHQIQGIHNDECLLLETVYEGVVVAVYLSTKIIVIDLRDWSEIGISTKLFTQPRSFMNGFGKYLSSFIVNTNENSNNFRNIKINDQLQEETELLIMTDNNIDSLILDVLFNGKYKREILNHEHLKKSIFDCLYKDTGAELSHLNLILENFDLCYNLLYILIQVQTKEWSNFVLLTYNRNTDIIDSVVAIDVEVYGNFEVSVIVDDNAEKDEPCLLLALRDYHNIYVVEVLTGIVKCRLDVEKGTRNTDKRSVVAWICPSMLESTNAVVVSLTTTKQLLVIKQKNNPLLNQSFSFSCKREPDFNLSNAETADFSIRGKSMGVRGDFSFSSNSKPSFIHPAALSTPLSKFDHMGDRFNGSLNASFNKSVRDCNLSTSAIGDVDKICTDTSEFGSFRKSVILYWQGYKNQSKRVLGPIIERANLSNDISLSMFVLQIVREIIDEYPSKDPRWTKIIKSNESAGLFFYSNKSLLLSQQLQSKKEALQKLVIMLKENDIDLFGPVGSIAPMAVCQSLYMERHLSDLTLFGGSQVTWPVAHCVGFGVELLEFVRILNDIMADTNSDEINQILTNCCQHVLAIEKKLTPLEIISQEISLVPRFIRHCCEFLQEKRVSTVESKDVHALVAKIISCCLRSALTCRQRYEESFLSANLKIETYVESAAAACWITENQPIGVLDSVVNTVACLVEHSRTLDSRVLEPAVDLVNVLLDTFRYRIDWMAQFSANDSEAVRIEEAFADTRSELIRKIVEGNQNLKVGLALAERHVDFQWLTSLCESLDSSQPRSSRDCRIEPFLRQFSAAGLPEFVLDWYKDRLAEAASGGAQGPLLAKIQLVLHHVQRIEALNASGGRLDSSCGSQVIGKFLEREEVQMARWLHEVEVGDFSEAAWTLCKLGEAERVSLARKKALLSLAKLSLLATDDQDDVSKETASVNRALEQIGFQEAVPEEVLSQQLAVPSSAGLQPVLRTHQVVKLLLAAAAAAQSRSMARAHLVRVLEVLAFAYHWSEEARLPLADWRVLLLAVWDEAVRQDEWADQSDDRAIKGTALFELFADASDRGLPMEVLLPQMDDLVEHARSQEKPYSAEEEFLVRRAFEFLSKDIGFGMEMDEASLPDEEEGMVCA